MAKRRRLTPANPGYLEAEAPATGGPFGVTARAPIAQVAGEASAASALSELGDVVEAARTGGRWVEALDLEAVDPRYLVRDRLVQEDEEMEALMASLASRGQQTPIEVVALPRPTEGMTHGLVSGWRRLTALKRLHARDGDPRFATVMARIVAPESRQDAYVAMVEENEIRANLSHYERARIALKAWQEGVYPTLRLSLQGLFGSVSRPKRSKIGSFTTIVEALDEVLRFPTAIPERLGLDLSQLLAEGPEEVARVKAVLKKPPPETPEDEIARLAAAVKAARTPSPAPPATPAPAPTPRITALDEDGIAARRKETAVETRFDAARNVIEITGGGVDRALLAELRAWLKTRTPCG